MGKRKLVILNERNYKRWNVWVKEIKNWGTCTEQINKYVKNQRKTFVYFLDILLHFGYFR